MSGEARNFLSATLKNHLSEIGKVLKEFEDFAQQRRIPGEAIQKVKVTFDELLSNSVSYGFPDGGEHEIEVVVEWAGGYLRITITDGGIPFNPFQQEPPQLGWSLEEAPVGGIGIHLVRDLMDEVFYRRVGDRNVVTLVVNW